MRPLNKENLIATKDSLQDNVNEIDMLLENSYKLRVSNVKESVKLVLKAKGIAQDQEDEDRLARCNCRLGLYYMIIGHNKEGLAVLQPALEHFQKTNDKEWIASALYNIGSIHYKSADYNLGMEYLLKCLDYKRELNDKLGESRTLKAIGYIYEIFGDFENALKTYLLCTKISRSIDDKAGESNACNPLSGLYLRQGNVKLAFETINESIKLKHDIGDERGLGFALFGKGKIHLYLNEFDEANSCFFESLEIHKEAGEILGAVMCYLKLGRSYIKQGKLAMAEKKANQALASAREITNEALMSKAYYLLYEVSKLNFDYEKALEFHENYHCFKENAINAESAGKINSKEAMFRAEKLEREASVEKEKSRMIQQKNAELDAFVHRVSHDLKGPISSLLGLHTVTMHDVKDPTARQFFELYHDQVNRLNGIVLDLINLTRIKDQPLKKVKIDFSQIITKCIDSFTYLTNFQNIKFIIDVQEGISYENDHGVINSIIQNLLENSIKYSKKDVSNTVTIKISQFHGLLKITVSDTGVGIPEEFQSKIFDMFFRANEDEAGTGLGLYILKNAVDKLEGKINLTSAVDIGTSIDIMLPNAMERDAV